MLAGKITKDKKDENMPYLEIMEIVLVYCNIVKTDYHQDLGVLYTFIPNKLFRQLLDFSPKNFIFFKKSDLEFSYIEVRFTDQNSEPLEVKDKVNINLVIN